MADYNKSLFISSTFRDMQSERDLMRDEVLAELQAELRLRGFSLDFIDLRWGISTEGSEENASVKIIKTCFDEIKRSKPFFLLFMGDRYGWIPPESDVRTSLVESGGEGIAYRDKSITALEIEYASKLFTDNEHCVFYFRDAIDFPPDTPDEIRSIYIPSADEAKRTAQLKQQLQRQFPERVRHYRARYDAAAQRLVIDGFRDSLLADLRQIFCDEIGSLPPLDYVETENNLLQSHTQDHLSVFTARSMVLAQIEQLVDSERVVAVSGESGSGKSCIMAKLCEVLRARENAEVLPLVCALTEQSASIEGVMRILSVNILDKLGLGGQLRSDILACTDAQTLYKQLYHLLYKLSEGGKTIYVVLDALNQLTRSDFQKRMRWLNTFALPENVRFLVSIVPDCDEFFELSARSACIYPIPFFSPDEIPEVVEKYMRRKNKSLAISTVKKIADKSDGNNATTSNPLYLSLLLDSLLYLGETDFASIRKLELQGIDGETAIKTYVEGLVEEAPTEFDDMLLHEIASIRQRLEPAYADIILGAVSLSRRGLPESWVEGIFNRMLAAQGKQFLAADFSLIRKLLRSHLVQKEYGKWGFGHKRIERTLRNHYAQDKEFCAKIYSAALDFLRTLPPTDPVRKAEEIFYLDKCGCGHEIADVLVDENGELDDAELALQTFEDCIRARIDEGIPLTDIFMQAKNRVPFFRAMEHLLNDYGLEFRYAEIILLESIAMLRTGEVDKLALGDAYARLSLEAQENNKLYYAKNTARIAAVLHGENPPKSKARTVTMPHVPTVEQARQAVAENESTDNLRILAQSCLKAAQVTSDTQEAVGYLKDAEDILKRIAYIDGGAEAFSAYTAALNQSVDYKQRHGLDAKTQIERLKEMRDYEIAHFGVIKDASIKRYEKATIFTMLTMFVAYVVLFTVFIQFGNGIALQFKTSYDTLFYGYLIPIAVQAFAAVFMTLALHCVYYFKQNKERFSAKKRYWVRFAAIYGGVSVISALGCLVMASLFRAFRLGFDYRASASGVYAYQPLWLTLIYAVFVAVGALSMLVHWRRRPNQPQKGGQ